MICPQCKSELIPQYAMSRCPFCDASLSSAGAVPEEMNSIQAVVRYLWENTTLLSDSEQVSAESMIAAFFDLAPDMRRESNLFSVMARSEALQRLMEVRSAPADEQRAAKEWACRYLQDMFWIRGDAAAFVWDEFWVGITGTQPVALAVQAAAPVQLVRQQAMQPIAAQPALNMPIPPVTPPAQSMPIPPMTPPIQAVPPAQSMPIPPMIHSIQAVPPVPEKVSYQLKAYERCVLPLRELSDRDFFSPSLQPDMLARLRQIVDLEAPIERSLLVKRLLASYGQVRPLWSTTEVVEQLIDSMPLRYTRQDEQIFYWRDDQNPFTYAFARKESDRQFVQICKQELRAAMGYVLQLYDSLDRERLFLQTLRLVTRESLASAQRMAMEKALSFALQSGNMVLNNDDTISLANP